MNGKLGSLDAPIYFVNHRDPRHPPGYIMMAPYSDFPTPDGYSREVADDLPAIDRLQKRLQEQEYREWEQEAERDMAGLEARFARTRDFLYRRMTSAGCSAYERDFCEGYLKLQDEKREKHRRNFECRNAYLWARENDIAKGRSANEESFNPERHEVKS